MAETADDLSTPLGQTTPRRKRRYRLPFTGIQLLAVLLGLFLVTFVGFAIFNDNPLGGEPIARVAIRPTKPAEEKPAAEPAAASEHAAKAAAAKHETPAEQKTVTIIDGSSGARHDVMIGSGEAAEKAGAAEPAAAPAMMAGIDARLLEKSRYGLSLIHI